MAKTPITSETFESIHNVVVALEEQGVSKTRLAFTALRNDIMGLKRSITDIGDSFKRYVTDPLTKLTDVNKRLVEFAVNSGNAAKALKSIGESYNAISGSTQRVVGGLDSINISAQKTLLSLQDIAETLNQFASKSFTARILIESAGVSRGLAKLRADLANIAGDEQSAKMISNLMSQIPEAQQKAFADLFDQYQRGVIDAVQLANQMIGRGALEAGLQIRNAFQNQGAFDDPMLKASIQWQNVMKRWDTLITNMRGQLAGKLQPAIEFLEKNFMKIIPTIEKVFNTIVKAIQTAIPYIEKLWKFFDSLPTPVKIFGAGLAAVMVLMPNLTMAIAGMAAQTFIAARNANALRQAFLEAATAGARGGIPAGGMGLMRGLGAAGAGYAAGQVGGAIGGWVGGKIGGQTGSNIGGVVGSIGSGALAGAAIGGPFGALIGGISAAIPALYSFAKATDLAAEASKLAAESAEHQQQNYSKKTEKVQEVLSSPDFNKDRVAIEANIAKRMPELQRQALAAAKGTGATGAHLEIETQRQLSGLTEKIAEEELISSVAAKTGFGKSEVKNRVRGSSLVSDIVQTSMSLGPGADTTEGLKGLKLAGQDLSANIEAFNALNTQMAAYSDMLNRLGPMSQIAGESVTGMLDTVITQTAEASKTQGEYIRKAIEEQKKAQVELSKEAAEIQKRIAGATNDAERKKAEEDLRKNIGSQEAIQKQIAQNQEQINSLKTQDLRITEQVMRAYEGQKNLLRANVEQMGLILDISSGLYGTAALSVQASLNKVKALEQEKHLVSAQLADLQKLGEMTDADGVKQKEKLEWQNKFKQLQNDQLRLTQQQVEAVRQLRDGYIGAIQAQATATGRFSKIIITEERNMQQAMERGMVRENFLLGGLNKNSARSYRFGTGGIGDIQYTSGGAANAGDLVSQRLQGLSGESAEAARQLNNVVQGLSSLSDVVNNVSKVFDNMAKGAGYNIPLNSTAGQQATGDVVNRGMNTGPRSQSTGGRTTGSAYELAQRFAQSYLEFARMVDEQRSGNTNQMDSRLAQSSLLPGHNA